MDREQQDREQQVRLNFLDEAGDYLDRLETIFLGIARGVETRDLDEALRAAHSIKGGAGMMGFASLSQIAHRLEDFLKILRVRLDPTWLDTDLETLLLQCADGLRQARDRHRQGSDATEVLAGLQPTFQHLRARLGELRPEDEDAISNQGDEADAALQMFEGGVDACLERLQLALPLPPVRLRSDVDAIAAELADFGRLVQLDAFVELCLAVRARLPQLALAQTPPFAERARDIWQRAHAMVVLGRTDRLRDLQTLLDEPLASVVIAPEAGADFLEADWAAAAAAWSDDEIGAWDDVPADFDLAAMEIPDPVADAAADFDPTEVLRPAANAAEFDLAATQFPESLVPEAAAPAPATEFAALSEEIAAELVAAAPAIDLGVAASAPTATAAESTGQTVRISLDRLRQMNSLFSELVLERNAIALRLAQLQTCARLLQERTRRLDTSNSQLRRWYDRASLEGMLPTAGGDSGSDGSEGTAPLARSAALEFDPLEMDRYTDLHLLAQDQMETVVQLREVSGDIDLALGEMDQAAGDLDRTTRTLQTNLTQTQMRPFSDLVGRYPRLVRDLSVRFDKPADLTVSGETVLLDRGALDLLSDPLVQLLRNAFAHGIEAPSERLAAGKPERGTIHLAASSQGSQVTITVRDDGRGIDTGKVRDRARRLGVPAARLAAMSETELVELIFEPGFSTAAEVTELSGRGIGMDVVRANLERARGTIRVSSDAGAGTTVTMTVPSALSILRVMLLETAEMVFAVAVDRVVAVTRVEDGERSEEEGRELLEWKGGPIPLLRLERALAFGRASKPVVLEGTPALDRETIAIVSGEEGHYGLWVQRFWGEREVTVRAVEAPLPLPPGFEQATVLGDGRVVPLLDLARLEGVLRVAPPERQSVPAASEATQRVLVVDDSINVRRLLATTLERAGYQVEQARDGQEAVDKLIGGLRVAAVVCDIEMPRLDGYGVVSELRSRAEFEQLPIAMLTSRSNEKHRKLALKLGATAYFSKPYNEQELLRTLATMTAAPTSVAR